MPRTRSLAWTELKVGVVSIFAVGISGLLIFLLSGDSGFPWQRYTVKAVFGDIAGLKTGAPVRVAGVETGTVTGIACNVTLALVGGNAANAGQRIGLTIPSAFYTSYAPANDAGIARQGVGFFPQGQDSSVFLCVY